MSNNQAELIVGSDSQESPTLEVSEVLVMNCKLYAGLDYTGTTGNAALDAAVGSQIKKLFADMRIEIANLDGSVSSIADELNSKADGMDITFGMSGNDLQYKYEDGPWTRLDVNSLIEDINTQLTEIAENLRAEINARSEAVGNEEVARLNADSSLQAQIDVLNSMTHIVGSVDTYAELPDASTVKLGDSYIVEVDETKGGQTSIYVAVVAGTETGSGSGSGDGEEEEVDKTKDPGKYILGETELAWDYAGKFTVDLSEYIKTTDAQALVSSEANARQQADSTLQTNISSEATARQQGDSALQTNINSEATARQQADSNLQNSISTLAGRFVTCTQAEYDASAKSADTYYFIKE